MADVLGNWKRTRLCGEFTKAHIEEDVVVMGYVAKYRNLGNLLFIDLRDRSGIVQVSFDKTKNPETFAKADKLRNEFVAAVKGRVVSRGSNVNKNIGTGEIEIDGIELKILAEAETAPFVIQNEVNASEALRLKYRYLDLRREPLQKIMIMRDKITQTIRRFLADEGFLDIETPILGKSTPEGARDYLVPSRVHQGSFYALPQSPQLYKQLLMIAGFDRYYQIAKCFRDEDLRANRQPEFTQVDMEMSYVNGLQVQDVAERLIKKVFSECIGMELKEPFAKISYQEAMESYGSDKPDLRYALKIVNVSDVVKNCGFSVFSDAVKAGGSVRAINAKGLGNKITRKEIDKLSEYVKGINAKGLGFLIVKEDGITCPFLKFLSEQEKEELLSVLDAQKGDVCFFIADRDSVVLSTLGALRVKLAADYQLFDKSQYNFVWVVDFPLLEYDEEEKRYVAVHHPFTAPKEEDIPLLDSNPLSVRSDAYDLVINGEEAGGGSVRIHTVEMQKKMFSLLGMSDEDIKLCFGYFVDAFRYGAPPHAGLAFGLDRLVMLLTGAESIKDVIAFPKMQNACCLMSEAPGEVEEKQLKELGIKIDV